MLIHLYMWLILIAVTASKSTRQANRDQASSVIGTASAAISAKPGRANPGPMYQSHW